MWKKLSNFTCTMAFNVMLLTASSDLTNDVCSLAVWPLTGLKCKLKCLSRMCFKLAKMQSYCGVWHGCRVTWLSLAEPRKRRGSCWCTKPWSTRKERWRKTERASQRIRWGAGRAEPAARGGCGVGTQLTEERKSLCFKGGRGFVFGLKCCHFMNYLSLLLVVQTLDKCFPIFLTFFFCSFSEYNFTHNRSFLDFLNGLEWPFLMDTGENRGALMVL